MAYYEGESLNERIGRGPIEVIPTEEMIEVFKQAKKQLDAGM
jgi:hypothetical protein